MNKKQAYGVPYQGSKGRICKDIVSLLPSAENFYDVFAGGCAVTGAALVSGKYQNFYINDLNNTPQLFIDAIAGKYKDKKEWVSREYFFAHLDDPYIRYIWGFANKGTSFMYAKDLEPYKEALWEAVVNDDWKLMYERLPEVAERCEEKLKGVTDTRKRRIDNQNCIRDWISEQIKTEEGLKKVQEHRFYKTCRGVQSLTWQPSLESLQRLESLQSLQSLERLESLESLQSLESLESLQSLERLHRTQLDYRELEIKPNSVIYCDPPYFNTCGYENDFDFEGFYNWCEQQTNPVFISEYWMPEDRFECIWSKSTNRKCAAKTSSKVTEKLFIPKK